MCSRPVGRIPLNTLLFFFNPVVTLAPKPSLQKSRFLASLEMTIVLSVSIMNTELGRAEARPYNFSCVAAGLHRRLSSPLSAVGNLIPGLSISIQAPGRSDASADKGQSPLHRAVSSS